MNTLALPRRLNLRPIASVQSLRKTFVVNIEQGLHARPCAMIVKTVHPYHSTVQVEVNGEMASGKSILGLMSLGAAFGSHITFHLVGEDAPQTMSAIQHLFDTHFLEALPCQKS